MGNLSDKLKNNMFCFTALSCKQAETCSECIGAGPECGWCEDKVR